MYRKWHYYGFWYFYKSCHIIKSVIIFSNNFRSKRKLVKKKFLKILYETTFNSYEALPYFVCMFNRILESRNRIRRPSCVKSKLFFQINSGLNCHFWLFLSETIINLKLNCFFWFLIFDSHATMTPRPH